MTDDLIPPQTDAVPTWAVDRPRRPARWKRRLAIGAGAVVVLGAGGVGFEVVLNHFGATVQRYLRTVGAGDYAGACAMLTDSAKDKLIAQEGAPTCEAAAEHWRASLTPSQVDWLRHGKIWVNGYSAEDSRKEIETFGNPIGIKNWAIFKHGGHESISDWGPESQQIPPATS